MSDHPTTPCDRCGEKVPSKDVNKTKLKGVEYWLCDHCDRVVRHRVAGGPV